MINFSCIFKKWSSKFESQKNLLNKIKDKRISPVSGTEPAWTQVQRPLEERLNNVRNIKEHSPSGYGTTNTKEWFVENFSLYYRGKEELVAPEFLKILQEIKDDKIP